MEGLLLPVAGTIISSALTGIIASILTVNRLKIHLDYLRRDVDIAHAKLNSHLSDHTTIQGCQVVPSP